MFDDITRPATQRSPLRRSKRAVTTGSEESSDGEIVISSFTPADHREQIDTSKNPLRRSTRILKPSVQLGLPKPRQAIKLVKIKMGKPQSKPTQEDLDKCEAKVETLEELVTHYKGGDHNSMESKQTNIGIFSL